GLAGSGLDGRCWGRVLDQLLHGQRGLSSLGPPGVQLRHVDLDERRDPCRIVETDLVDEPAVARRLRVGHDDAIDGPLLAAVTGETDLHHLDCFPRSASPGGRPCIIGPEPSFFRTFLVWVNCLSSRFTSDTEVPLPDAMRLRRLAFRMWMLRRSSLVIES